MIRLDRVSKAYGATRAVDDLTFTAPPGRVTGFLGPNGAGKSTTLRILCGLTHADAGTATIGGVRYADLPIPGRVVGVMLGAGALHPGRTGAETLRLASLATGVTSSRVGDLLDRVGLGGAGRKRVGAYSLGMRRRLGLAAALVGDPEVLVLDEPANGLDPGGIVWMRDLLDSFAGDGGTVLLSSHLLAEVQMIADRIVVVAGGRLVAQGNVADVLAPSGPGVWVDATHPAALARALDAAGLPVRLRDDGGLLVEAPAERVGAVALDAGLVLTRLEPRRADLESAFLDLTARP